MRRKRIIIAGATFVVSLSLTVTGIYAVVCESHRGIDAVSSVKSVHPFSKWTGNNKCLGNSHLIDVPFIEQSGYYPTGCESVTAVMALNYVGMDMMVDDFIDDYLDRGTMPYEENGELFGDSPWECFLGSPYDADGWGCYAPVIERALSRILDEDAFSVQCLCGEELETLCENYIDNNIPVIMWATMEMSEACATSTWTTPNGERITWIAPEHCLLLVGYDEEFYYFNDPRQGKEVAYEKDEVSSAYESLFRQAVAITENR